MNVGRICPISYSGKPFAELSTDEKLNVMMKQIVQIRIDMGVYANGLAKNQENLRDIVAISARETMNNLAPNTKSFNRFANKLKEVVEQHQIDLICH